MTTQPPQDGAMGENSAARTRARWRWLLFLSGLLVSLALGLGMGARRQGSAKTNAFDTNSVISADFFQKSWRSGKILAGHNALAYLRKNLDQDPALFAVAETALIEAGHDADALVRQMALLILEYRHHPALHALAAEQLTDADPELRLLGLETLTRSGSSKLAGLVGPLLSDPDPRIALTAATALRQWLSKESPSSQPETGAQGSEVQRWQEWWRGQAGHFGETPTLTHAEVAPRLLQASEFKLEDWRGQVVQTSNFKDRTLLLFFFDPEITNSVADLPILCDLQQRFEEKIAVLGIASDIAALNEKCNHPPDKPCSVCAKAKAGLPPVDVPHMRAHLAELANTHQVKFPMVIDPRGNVLSRYGGARVPVCVLIDRQGHLWRRFEGNRGRSAWEAMVTEALHASEPHLHAIAAHRPKAEAVPSVPAR